MKNFSAKFLVMTLMLGSLVFGPSCATVTNPDGTVSKNPDYVRIATVVKMSAELGVYAGIRQDPNTRAYFQAAVVVMSTLIDKGEYDPAVLDKSLSDISVKEVRTPEVKLAIQAALEVYKVFWSEQVSQSIDKWEAKPVLVALRDGIAGGLNAVAVESQYGLRRSK